MNDNWTEKLIDAHLEAPNTAEPSLGFESRMLAGLAERKATRRPAFWVVWASAAAVAAVITIVFFARPLPKPMHVETAKTVAPAPPANVNMDASAARTTTRVTAAHTPSMSNKATIATYPAQFFGGSGHEGFFQATSSNAFPSASSLSDQEYRLVAMVSTMSGQQQRALAETLEASRIPDAEPTPIPESSLRPATEIKNTH